VQVAVPECPTLPPSCDPVFALHANVSSYQVRFCCWLSLLHEQAVLAADRRVNVTDAPKIDGLPLCSRWCSSCRVMVKLFDCELAECCNSRLRECRREGVASRQIGAPV